jgi:hypothetical protein
MYCYCTLRAYFLSRFFLMNCFDKIPFRKMHSVIMYMSHTNSNLYSVAKFIVFKISKDLLTRTEVITLTRTIMSTDGRLQRPNTKKRKTKSPISSTDCFFISIVMYLTCTIIVLLNKQIV